MSFVVRLVCPGYTQALAFAAALLFGFRGVCEGWYVLAIAGLSPSCFFCGFRGVCEGRCVPAIAGLSPSCFFCQFSGRCVRWCVLAIAGLPRLYLNLF